MTILPILIIPVFKRYIFSLILSAFPFWTLNVRTGLSVKAFNWKIFWNTDHLQIRFTYLTVLQIEKPSSQNQNQILYVHRGGGGAFLPCAGSKAIDSIRAAQTNHEGFTILNWNIFIILHYKIEQVSVHDFHIHNGNTLHLTLPNADPNSGDLQFISAGPQDKALILRGGDAYPLDHKS